MAFHEVLFPDAISYGSQMGPGHSTLTTEISSGAEQRVSRWGVGKIRMDVGYRIRSRDNIYNVIEFARLRAGAAHGFRIRDHTDYNSTTKGRNATDPSDGGADPADTDQAIGSGDATETVFQLIKTYTDGVAPDKVRNITKPRTGTVVVKLNGVAQTLGTHFTVDTTTGILTFTTAPPSGHAITAGYEFDVPVRFSGSIDGWLAGSIDDYDSASVPGLEVVEIIDEIVLQDDFWYGGSNTFSFSANTQISIGSGRVKVANATTTSLILVLPASATLPLGGPYFYIVGASGTSSFTVEDSLGGLVATITAGDIVEIFLYLNASSVRTWGVR